MANLLVQNRVSCAAGDRPGPERGHQRQEQSAVRHDREPGSPTTGTQPVLRSELRNVRREEDELGRCRVRQASRTRPAGYSLRVGVDPDSWSAKGISGRTWSRRRQQSQFAAGPSYGRGRVPNGQQFQSLNTLGRVVEQEPVRKTSSSRAGRTPGATMSATGARPHGRAAAAARRARRQGAMSAGPADAVVRLGRRRVERAESSTTSLHPERAAVGRTVHLPNCPE